MSHNSFTIEESVVEQLVKINALDSIYYDRLMVVAVKNVCGEEDTTAIIQGVAEESGISASKLGKLCLVLTSLLWEAVKFLVAEDSSVVQSSLSQLGLSEEFVHVFLQSFMDNKRRFLGLKKPLGGTILSYENMAWRLDVVLAKRMVASTTEPKYRVRLDLAAPSSFCALRAPNEDSPTGSTDADSSKGGDGLGVGALPAGMCAHPVTGKAIVSVDFESDYASMKHLQNELQRAVNEYNAAHAQRLHRYIS